MNFAAIAGLALAILILGSQRGKHVGGLARGQSGQDVLELQQRLQYLGYQLAVDGKFGPETDLAVRSFQADEGIASDGIVGPVTAARLRSAQPNHSRPTSYEVSVGPATVRRA